MRACTRNAQRGTALVVSLIMLVLVTLLVMTALNLASSTFRSVSNTQFRDEAIAAANVAIQTVLSAPFTDEPQPDQVQPLRIRRDQADKTEEDGEPGKQTPRASPARSRAPA